MRRLTALAESLLQRGIAGPCCRQTKSATRCNAKFVDQARVDELADYYLRSGRIASLWRESFSVRNSFINCYNFIQPLITVKYVQTGSPEVR